MNQADRNAEYSRLDRENRDTVQLFREGKITEEECKTRCEAIKAEVERLIAEAESQVQDSGNGKE